MPDFNKLHQKMKPREDVQITQPKAFEFKSDQRGLEHRREWQEKIRKEQEELSLKR